jgi:gliding motility-associated-like protein
VFITLLALQLSAKGISPNEPAGMFWPISMQTNGGVLLSKWLQNAPCNPSVSVTPTAYSLCPKDSVQLTASGAVTYTWTPTTGLSCSNCANPKASPSATITYNVAGTNAANCIDSTKVTITVGGIIVSISGSSSSICQQSKDTLTASGADSYVWNTGATTSSIIVSPASTFTYSVTGTSLTCQNSASFTVTVFPLPVIIISGNNDICSGSSTTLTASGAANYLWAPSSGLSCTSCSNPTADPGSYTIYTIIGTDNNGCSNAVTDTVNVIPLPTVSVSSIAPVCPETRISLTGLGSPPGGTYSWQPGNIPGQTLVDTIMRTTLFLVDYVTGCGTATDTVTVGVNPVPTLFFSTIFKKLCVGSCDQFTASSAPASIGIAWWSWDFGDDSTVIGKDPVHCYAKPGEYTVTLTVQTTGGCQKSDQIPNMVTVFSKPQAAFYFSPDPVSILDPVVSFTNNSSDANPIDFWSWNFGENADSNSFVENPTHTYQDTGRYCVRLSVTDVNGCVDSTTQCIDIGTQYTFYIPSAFSPNGDNVNDVFIPKGTDIRNFEMYIFDRWGNQVFYTEDITNGWNGGKNNNGSKISQEDVYVYVINVIDTKDIQHHYKGAVTLLK